MNLFYADNISKHYGIKPVLEDVCLGMEEGQKAALVGINGSGKTTLLRILAGELEPDSGSMVYNQRFRVEYLAQDPEYDRNNTVLQEIFSGSTPELDRIRAYEDALEALEEAPEDPGLQKRLHRQTLEMETHQLWNLESEAKSILTKLGITGYHRTMGTLSGGERRRVFLARTLIRPADFLILDEPTNHLDSETIDWLEQLLASRNTALLLVTHDRYFLDRTVKVILELTPGGIVRYPGNFSLYLEMRNERLMADRSREEKHWALYRQELDWMRSGVKARGTRQKARMERFERLEAGLSGRSDRKLDMMFRSSRLGKSTLELEDITKGYGEQVLIRPFSYVFSRHDRIGIVGKNGTGKTTFLNLLAGLDPPDSGRIVRGETLNIGYFRQESGNMDPDQSLLGYLEESHGVIRDGSGNPVTAAQLLEKFLFPRNRHRQKIGTLSGGERRRLALLRVLAEAPNMLLLDEPANDLDIETLMVLEDFLDHYDGIVVAVSHDRYFLDKTVNSVFAFREDGTIDRFPGNYQDFRRLDEKKDIPASGTEPREKNGETRQRKSTGGLTYAQRLEYTRIEEEIGFLEQEISCLDEACAREASNYPRLRELAVEKEKLEQQLEDNMERWMVLAAKAEEGMS